MENQSLLTKLSRTIDQHRQEQRLARANATESTDQGLVRQRRNWGLLLIANTMITVLIVSGIFWAQSVGAISLAALATGTSTGTIAYQGRLADAAGNPLTQTVNMVFRLYAAAEGGAPLWEEQWTASNGVQVSDGLFNVMLGSLTPIPQAVVTANDPLFLGISVGTDDEMAPRVQLGSVPFAVQALTVPDGSITQEKLSPEVSLEPPDGSITTAKLNDGAVTSAKQSIKTYELTDGSSITVQGATPTTVSEFTIANAPAGDVVIVCTFVASANQPGNGWVYLYHGNEIAGKLPAHLFASQWDLYTLHGRYEHEGGDFAFRITAGGETATSTAVYLFGAGGADGRFGRRCTVTAGL